MILVAVVVVTNGGKVSAIRLVTEFLPIFVPFLSYFTFALARLCRLERLAY